MGNQKQDASKGTHYSQTLRSRDRRRERHDSQGHCAQGDKKEGACQEGHQEGYKEASCQEDSQEASCQEDSQEASCQEDCEKESSQEEGYQEVNGYQQRMMYLPVFVRNQMSCALQKVSVIDQKPDVFLMRMPKCPSRPGSQWRHVEVLCRPTGLRTVGRRLYFRENTYLYQLCVIRGI